jgi:small conductance mechanosensitive channel
MQQLWGWLDANGLELAFAILKALLRILSLLVAGLLILRLLDSALKRLMHIVPSNLEEGKHRLERRAETLRQIARSVGRGVLGVVVFLEVTSEVGYPMGPLLAGAGIVGLAIGFGAQSLVKDVISGFFVILEDQYGVGDVVRTGALEGTVEGMSLRVTVLRGGDGEVHVIPNGAIQSVTVLSKDWRRVLVDVPVARNQELGRVFGVLSKVGEKLAADLPAHVLDRPAVVGVERLTGPTIWIRVGAKTPPSRYGELAHEWRFRIVQAFEREGIVMAEEKGDEPRAFQPK